jgi:glycosyltransferase involved in cell wall biosynthesis
MQYERLFNRSAVWDAEYTTRHSEGFARLVSSRQLPLRILTRILRVPLNTYSKRWEKKQEDKIVELARDFDLVFIVKSGGTPLYRRLLQLNRPRVAMDINDAVWLPEFHWDDLDALLAEVHGVVCENEYVADYARRFNSRVFVVPDPPQVEAFDLWRNKVKRDPERIVLGWIGGAQNIGPLYAILETLEELFRRYPQLHLRIVGADKLNLGLLKHIRYSFLGRFNQKEMVREVLKFNIGLFPLFHNEDGRARGTLKAMVYMSGEVVAACENYGENPNLIQNGVNGILASSPEEWQVKLDRLIKYPNERFAIAQRGLKTIRDNFTAELIFARLLAAFDEILI